MLEAPQLRFTQDNQTPVAEMLVQVEGLRPDDPPGQLKVVGWGNLAQDLQNRVQPGQRLVLEGRLRMSTVTRQDGIKEKRTEFTLSRLHPLTAAAPGPLRAAAPGRGPGPAPTPAAPPSRVIPARVAPDGGAAAEAPSWNTAPLVPDLADGDDEIPF